MLKLSKTDEPYLKPEEVAELIRVKPSTIVSWARQYSDFPHLGLPGSIRIRLSEVTAWLEQFQRQAPETELKPHSNSNPDPE
jgi:predicted DNA-binding transcriptional regulator AlpA